MSNYFVAKTGSDQYPGSRLQPFLTVAEGLHQLYNGDTLYVFAGTYSEDFVFTNAVRNNHDVWLKNARVVAYPGEEVILHSTTSDTSKTLGYFSTRGALAVQDPANYAGVTLTDVANKRDDTESTAHVFCYAVGGAEFVTAAPSDLTPPTVTISAPAANAVLSGTVEVEASATDNVAVESMWLKLDGITVHSEEPEDECTVNLDTTLCLNGPHILTAWAKDTSGNIGVSAPLWVNVDNVPPILATDESLLTASITFTSPSGGEKWRDGMVVDITWTSVGLEGNVDVYFIQEGVSRQVHANIPNTGSISWTVVGHRGPHCRMQLRSINDTRVVGYSAEFELVN